MVAEPCCIKMQQGPRNTGSPRFEIDEEKGIATDAKVRFDCGSEYTDNSVLVGKGAWLTHLLF